MAARWLCISTLSLLLIACGGGGSDGGGSSFAPGANPPPSGGDTSGGNDGTVSPPTAFTHDGSARFNTPGALSLHGDGTLYVSDQGNGAIRRIDAGGEVSTPHGSYGIIAERTDASGNLHLLDNVRLYRISPTGESTLIREFANQPGSYTPTHLSADAMGNSYVLLQYRQLHQIWRFGATGSGQMVYSGGSYGSVADFASDSQGNLALALNGPMENTAFIIHIPRPSQPAEQGTPGVSTVQAATDYLPSAMVIDEAGNAYFVDVSVSQIADQYYYSGMRIFRVGLNGVVTTLLDGFPDGTTDQRQVLTNRRFVNAGLALDAGGGLYFSDPRGNAIYRMDSAGNLTLIAGTPGQAGNSN